MGDSGRSVSPPTYPPRHVAAAPTDRPSPRPPGGGAAQAPRRAGAGPRGRDGHAHYAIPAFYWSLRLPLKTLMVTSRNDTPIGRGVMGGALYCQSSGQLRRLVGGAAWAGSIAPGDSGVPGDSRVPSAGSGQDTGGRHGRGVRPGMRWQPGGGPARLGWSRSRSLSRGAEG